MAFATCSVTARTRAFSSRTITGTSSTRKRTPSTTTTTVGRLRATTLRNSLQFIR